MQVNITGGNGQGQWRINDETTWRNSGDTLQRISTGQIYIYYKTIAGYITPANDIVSLSANQTTIKQVVYGVMQYITLRVNLSGANGQGQWRINGDNVWYNSGDTLRVPSHLEYEILCKNVPHWAIPQLAIYSPNPFNPTTFNLTYTPLQYATLQVNLAGGANAGQWRIKNTNVWRNSGNTTKLIDGYNYIVEYKPVAGWATPPNDTYTAVANQTQTLTGTYNAIVYGFLVVNLVAGNDLGQWRVTGDFTWYNSGDTVRLSNQLSSYNIGFKTVSGWITPNSQIYFFNPNITTTKTGVYSPNATANLIVNLTGANGQGLWSEDQLLWHTSGETLTKTANSTINIYFAPVANWKKPIMQTIAIALSQTTTTIGNYTQLVGLDVNAPTFASTIMPNPANDYLRCTTNSTDIDTPLQINLYNSLGVLLYSSSLSANDEHHISTAEYANGFYIVQIFDPRTKAAILHKVIIQH